MKTFPDVTNLKKNIPILENQAKKLNISALLDIYSNYILFS